MSKVIRQIRNRKFKLRLNKQFINPSYPVQQKNCTGLVKELFHESGRGCPLVLLEVDGQTYNVVATEGISVGQTIEIGNDVPCVIGNRTSLKNIPLGSFVNSVEYQPFDGGKAAMTAGAFCTIVDFKKEINTTVLRYPSGIKREFSGDCRAVIGICSGAGITEKPLLKAGTAYYLNKAKGRKYPRVRCVAMNPVDHAHGGGNHQHIGKPSTIGRNVCPAQRVGLYAARQTGRAKNTKKNN